MTNGKSLPVWIYWEGKRPWWIEKCLETQLQHWDDVRVLSPAEWNALWRHDRDVEPKLAKLCIAHRADVIRAYLVSHYGGLWIDSDCLVFRNLRPVMNLLNQYDLLCHPQFDNVISCAFVGSKPQGVIASAWYARQIEILRNNEPIEWLSLSSDALMNAIWKTQHEYYRIENHVIQPVWYCDQPAFFRQRTDDDHTSHLVPDAFCYMMCHSQLKDSELLMEPDTLFSFLLRCSKQNVGASPIRVTGKPHIGNY